MYVPGIDERVMGLVPLALIVENYSKIARADDMAFPKACFEPASRGQWIGCLLAMSA